MSKLILLNKPYRVLPQFTDSRSRPTLADFIAERNVYPAGRLDYDSEGLILLTDDGPLKHRISHPSHKLAKVYYAQVEGTVADEALQQLRRGVELRDGPTRPAQVQRIPEPALWPREPPVRERRHIPTSWLQITLTEGRNRQVRRMTAAVGHPTLRLVRVRVGDWSLDGLRPGEHRTITVHAPQPAGRRVKRRSRKV